MITSPYQLMAYDTAEETAFEGEVLAFERQPAVAACPLGRQVSNPPQAPDDAPLVHVHITVFFDGTGNSMLSDGNHETNVVKLFDLHRVGWEAGTTTINGALYIRGVGTLNTSGGTGAARLQHAQQQSARRMEQLTGAYGALERSSEAPAQVDGTSTYSSSSWASRRASDATDAAGSAFGYGMEQRIAEACRWVRDKASQATPRTGMVTLNAIGFSRGAAECRSFWNKVYDEVRPQISARNPFRFNFLGLFDTVAAIGTSGGGTDDTPGHNIVLASDRITAMSTSVSHFVAHDEFRTNFRYNPGGSGVTDQFYTGCHSDIGGGYTEVPSPDPRASGHDAADGDGSQGRHNRLPMVTLVDMHAAASTAGLPLDPLRETIVNQAERIRRMSQAFDRCRSDVWAMALALHKDCAYAMVTTQEATDWYMENRASTDLREQMESAGTYSRAVILDNDPGHTSFMAAFDFWRHYIHLPYYQRGTFGHGPAEAISSTISAVGMGFDSLVTAPDYSRSPALHYVAPSGEHSVYRR